MPISSLQVSVLLVDDHSIARAGCRAILEHSPAIRIFAEAESGEQACRLVRDEMPDVILMDIQLPGISGIETIGRILEEHPHARFLVISRYQDTQNARQALQAGARGYICKCNASTQLPIAVRRIAQGGIHIEQEIAQQLAYQNSAGHQTPLDGLSLKETEVMRLMALGNNLDAVACQLALSYKTVANYSTKIKSKLGIESIADLTRLAIRYGLIDA